jgi:hypothetical protein
MVETSDGRAVPAEAAEETWRVPSEETWRVPSEETWCVPADEVIGLLRRAARDLKMLENSPPRPGDLVHITGASQAVHLALIQMESLCSTGPSRM